ncbi:lysophospholipid acyltransferase family protein [Saccharospirillum impatiens]|uniref:lysophospholipid acyltransferase family protein n=1 Tax=Saccharospirillum impatiens TaxID=169438 RepID=UPI0003FBB82E|nr:lysophospholipid acyltransferase family protein [Saccharospirillum impatiens]
MHEPIQRKAQRSANNSTATPASNPFAMTGLNPVFKTLLNGIARLSVLRNWYDEWLAIRDLPASTPGASVAARFLDFSLGKLDATLTISNPERADEVPGHGPFLVVANHPLGALEGMLLSQWLLRKRPDLKVMVNQILLSLPEFQSLFIGVDVLHEGQQRRNARGLRDADRHLKQGGALLLFPAGTVSRLDPRTGEIDDALWNTLAGHLALRHQARVLPIHIQGRNPMWFYWAGVINKRLRTALLPRAMLANRGQTVAATLGPLFDAGEKKAETTAASLTQRLRVSCELLDPSGSGQSTLANHKTLANAHSNLKASMARMAEFKVAEQGDLSVYLAPYEQLGDIAEHLAVERERCFRAAGEGTGLSQDVDRFDPHYWHIWGWDRAAEKITGGYRLARVTEVVKSKGLSGLYSHALFDYDNAFLTALGHCVEVGRSFVTEDYQRHPRALDLLWRGIGAFVNQQPQVHTLFGCVSISGRFVPVARALLADSLLAHHRADSNLHPLIRPRAPLQFKRRLWTDDLISTLTNVSAVNALLDHCPTERKIPTLIRHYLNLNGKFLSFTVNHGFNQSLDGLIMVDLRQTPDQYLNRYLGRSGADRFRLMNVPPMTREDRHVA